MTEIKEIIDDLGIEALEKGTKLAGFAVMSDSGNIIYQTANWDLTNQTNVILDVVKGGRSFVLSDGKFTITETTAEGIVGTSNMGLGYVIFTPFQGGVLVSYAMPGADTPKLLSYLKNSAMKLNGKI
jgi:hypothetical protein